MRTLSRKIILLLAVFAAMILPVEAGSLLLLHADSPEFASGAQARMLATGRFSSVDLWDMRVSLPTLGQIGAYDGVLSWTNYVPNDAAAVGNLLADFYDLGSKHLSVATYGFSNPWAIGGRVTTGDYAGLTNLGTNGDVSGVLLPTNPADPLWDGINVGAISYYHNGNFAHPGLAGGALLVATDGGGIYMIARSANGVMNFNLFPGYLTPNNDEFYNLLANSFGPGAIPEPSTYMLVGAGLLGLLVSRRRR